MNLLLPAVTTPENLLQSASPVSFSTSCSSKEPILKSIYVETLLGRKRFLSKINFGSSKEKAKAQRQAVNSICQGSAADVIKVAMIKIHTVVSGGGELAGTDSGSSKQFSILRGQCRIILQVHDELVLEVDPRLVREAAMLLRMSMEGAVSLSVPLRIKMKIGSTWGTQEPYQLNA